MMCDRQLVEGKHYLKRRGRVMFSWSAMRAWVEEQSAPPALDLPLVKGEPEESASRVSTPGVSVRSIPEAKKAKVFREKDPMKITVPPEIDRELTARANQLGTEQPGASHRKT